MIENGREGDEKISENELEQNGSDTDIQDENVVQEEDDNAGLRRKRKRKSAEGDLEDAYMRRLARAEAKEAEKAIAERIKLRKKVHVSEQGHAGDEAENQDINQRLETVNDQSPAEVEDSDRASLSPPPQHETVQAADDEMSKANRTIFLGNVSTAAITSKSSRKALLKHLESFSSETPDSENGSSKHTVESIRFRSTAYASAIPKKAAFVKKELMDATTKSTNAYAVYLSAALAREATKVLNGTVVLGRHLRVDLVAHPAKVDNRRCVFVGNLGFVDDESNIQQANEDEGREKRRRNKTPADVEEGLWRCFAKCGNVESVRVIRDSTTRVGKGVAYVQFEDENGVEAALQYDGKKFPPMLPRKLRVSRAKAPKRKPTPGSGRPAVKTQTNSYQRKLGPEEASQVGRAAKLLGRAGAAQTRQPSKHVERTPSSRANGGIRKPEEFIFEGQRASVNQGKLGLKLGGRGNNNKKKKGKVTKRSASFKAGEKKG